MSSELHHYKCGVDRKSNKDEESYLNPELLDEESFLKRQKLWGLFSFIIWNPSLQNPIEEKSITKKCAKKNKNCAFLYPAILFARFGK